MLEDQALKTHPAGGAEEIRTNLTPLERTAEDALRAPRQRGLAEMQR